MLNKDQIRELAYLVKVDEILPMNADRLECARVGGWNCVVGKNEFNAGDIAVYFEIDSQLPDKAPFSSMEFLRSKDFKIKSQKIRGVVSQGLLVPIIAFGWTQVQNDVIDDDGIHRNVDNDSRFLTQKLEVTYNVAIDNVRKGRMKSSFVASFGARHPKLVKTKLVRWVMLRKWGRNLLYWVFGKKCVKKTEWPEGRFPGVKKTDQERIENMTWVLNDKTPYVRTQKCDGTSGTFILEKKKFGRYEFYVCSRNVRMMSEDQECFYKDENVYWAVAKKYDIERKMKEYLKSHRLTFVCWQGEICGPKIQNNPQKLNELRLFCFHWTDDHGRMDIRDAARVWKELGMEVVPIDDELYTLPDNLETFKLTADGYYDESCCGQARCAREGYVYYKSTEPTFSFKNVSRNYLLKHNG